MNDSIDLLRKGTESVYVAKNWHQQGVISEAEGEIEKLSNDINLFTENSVEVDAFSADLIDIKQLLAKFLTQWPAPLVESIYDKIKPLDKIPSAWHSLELEQSRPRESLICRSDAIRSSVLFYENGDSGRIHKVPNIWYNQPNRAKVITYTY